MPDKYFDTKSLRNIRIRESQKHKLGQLGIETSWDEGREDPYDEPEEPQPPDINPATSRALVKSIVSYSRKRREMPVNDKEDGWY